MVAETMSSHNDVTIYFYVSMLRSDWTIRGMNMKLTQSHLLLMNATLENSNTQTKKLAEIGNSFFGRLNISGYEVRISECSIDGTYRSKVTLLDIRDSRLNVTNSSFYNHEVKDNSAIINASSTDVKIKDSVFTKNLGKEGVIQLLNGSNLELEKCNFSRNGEMFFAESTILLKSKSSVRVVDCFFHLNWASSGGCFRVYPNTHLAVERSNFTDNTAQKGGVIYCEGNSNTDQNVHPDKLVLNENYSYLKRVTDDSLGNVSCIIKRSYFEHNVAIESGGSVFLNRSKVDLFSSNFVNNSVAFGSGGALAAHRSKVNIGYTNFTLNAAMIQGGALHFADYSSISIHQTTFLGSCGITGSSLSITCGVVLTITNSTVKERFCSNFPFLKGFSMYFNSQSEVTISACYFEAKHPSSGIMYLEDNMTMTCCNCTFKNVKNSSSLAFSASESVTLRLTKCNFIHTGGFSLSQKTSLHLEQCLITSSQNILNNALILMTGQSEIIFSFTNITNIIPTLDQRFLQATSSSINITHCLYSGNNVFRHFDVTGSVISVEDSKMINNTCADSLIPFSSIFYVSDGELIVIRSTFNDNYHSYVSLFLMSIIASSSSDISLTDSIFSSSSVNSSADFVLYMRSSSVSAKSPNNYLQIENCTFDNKGGSFRIHRCG